MAQVTAPDLGALADRLRAHVEELARSPRVPGSERHRAAARYVTESLTRAGFAVAESRFRAAGASGVNLLTRPVPDRPDLPLFIVGAHYDSQVHTSGADDNASGVAALLELAAWLGAQSPSSPPCRLQLAAYDLEEYGMVGSLAHCLNLESTRTPVAGMISLEMLAYTDARPGSQRLPPELAHVYPDVGNFIGVCGNEASRTLAGIATAALKSIAGLPVETLVVPGNGEVFPEVRLSDHSSFWDHGHPALMITDTSFFRNPHYHRPSDTADTLDYPFFARVTAGVFEIVRRLLDPHFSAMA